MTTAQVRLLRMRWWHIDQITTIEDELFGPERWSAGMFWNELANGHHYLIASDGSAPAATDASSAEGASADDVVLGYGGLAASPPDEAWVQNIAVRRDAQRRGVGRALLEALLAESRRRGCRRTLLEVAVDNGPAQRLYERYGFSTVGVRRGYYQPSNTDALVMAREED